MAEFLSQHMAIECTLRIFISLFAGFLLGLERKSRLQVVGMRTLILISVSSCLLGILSTYMAGICDLGFKVSGDPTRIAAGVVSGVGFLGGGAILRQGMNIKGLTSAAIIWASMSVGLSFGSGLYIPGFLVVVVVLFSLFFFGRLEEKLFPAGRAKTIHIMFEDADVDIQEVRNIITQCSLVVTDVNLTRVYSTNQLIVRFCVLMPRIVDYKLLSHRLSSVYKLGELTISD